MSSNFVRFQKILNQAYAESFSCLSHEEVRNPHPLHNCGLSWTSSLDFPNNISGPVEGGCDGFFAYWLFGLAIGVFIVESLKILSIIGACVLGVAIIVGLVYCLWRYCRSEDQKETQVVPISIVETCDCGRATTTNYRGGSGYAVPRSTLATSARLPINTSLEEGARTLDCGPSQSSDVAETCTVAVKPL